MKFDPINPKYKHLLHGGDYNPDQWLDYPGIIDEDFRLMELSGCNTMSIGIFSWTGLEPEEDKYDFSWMDNIMDRLYSTGKYAVLATPSGARPAWMAQKYPEVLRVSEDRQKMLYGLRHNHCFTSPVYRMKSRKINALLAERYKDHPALLIWHISNEFGGECHCDLCQEAFRNWLKNKYQNDLDLLNHEWWTRFWSHTYTDWSQIESPSSIGEASLHGLKLDWKRFVSYQTADFIRNETIPLKEITPDIPITTNLMGTYDGLDYFKLAKELDVVSWDNYPCWHGNGKDRELGSNISFLHDLNRSLKNGKPFMMMESTPSMTNWHPVPKLKRPGMHLLSSLQAIAHGSDTVQYFQWRKSRGSSEKLHGAVVDHVGSENTRVFRDVAEVGNVLKKLDCVVGTSVNPDVAIIYDWENKWALNDAQGLHNIKKDYEPTCQKHYEAFWQCGVPADIIDMDCNFSSYKLIVAPMLYMLKPGAAEKIDCFVKNGGTFVTTYCSGLVNENDLCFLGGFPGPLRPILGIWAEETDALYENDINYSVIEKDSQLSISGEYKVHTLCDIVHAETAEVLAHYKDDFYAGTPSLTVNRYGKGQAYYIAFRNNDDFERDFYRSLIEKLDLRRALHARLPEGVTAQLRTDGEKDFIFVMNFTDREEIIDLEEKVPLKDMLTGAPISDKIELKGYGVRIIERIKRT